TAHVHATDDHVGSLTIELDTITCNQPVNTTGDGNTDVDITNASYGTYDTTFSLRCERRGDLGGNSDRVYTIVYKMTAGANTVTYATATFSITHDQSHKGVVTMAGVESQENISIDQNYPNPFKTSTSVSYTLKQGTNV